MSNGSFIFLSAIGAIIFQPFTIIALVLAQVANLVIGIDEHRWLPAGLLAVAVIWCFIYPYWHR